MADWTYFRYGTEHHQIAKHWIPATGTNRGCLVYVPGGGWSTTSEREFYEPSVKKAVLEEIEDNEDVAGEQMVCISMQYSLAFYDFAQKVGAQTMSHPGWDVGHGTYVWDAYVWHAGGGPGTGKAYRCIQQHTAASDKEPGVGANWEDYWVEPANNDIGNRTMGSGAQVAQYYRCASRAGCLQHGVWDVLQMVQFLKQNAVFFGINPGKIVLMGDSAGGATAGAAAYSFGREWSRSTSRVDTQARDLMGGRKDMAYRDSGVSGVILERTPCDWRHYAEYVVQHGGFLFGVLGGGAGNQQEYDRVPASLKAAISPLGSLKATANAIPTFLHYFGSEPGDGGDPGPPPWTAETPYHHAANGVLIEAELARLQQPNRPFYHDGNMPADIGLTMLNWLRSLWGYPLAS